METEWVEILDPRTREKMYANVKNGDCSWEAPEGVQYKPMSNNQWWELYDAQCQCNYYYNVATEETVWERPVNCDIIPLSRLQAFQEGMASEEQNSSDSPLQDVATVGESSAAEFVSGNQPASPEGHNPSAYIHKYYEDHEQHYDQQQQEYDQQQYDQQDQDAAFDANDFDDDEFDTEPPTQRGSAPPLPQHVLASPNPPPMPQTKVATADLEISKFDKIQAPKKKLFKKKVTLSDMLSWTKEPISDPMLRTPDKKRRKEAVEMFKLIQMYMGDRRSKSIPSKGKDRDQALLQLLLDIISRTWAAPVLRDELFVQLCRQTSDNRDKKSLHAGWEIMATALGFYPPSSMFHSYLEGYISRNAPTKPIADLSSADPVKVFALYCSKRMERLRHTGARKGKKKPTIEEVERARTLAFNPSMFGEKLQDVVEMQKTRFPDRQLPWILTSLSDEVLRLNARETEGIFRVPGDVDEVNVQKLRVDRFEPPVGLIDAHVPASLLKLWFRELLEPIIPEALYDRCISISTNVQEVLAIVASLPDLNRLVLMYIVRFLQKFAHPEVTAHTKMDVNNLAMVWAPNCLRCPYDNPALIFENTRKEMEFVRTLIVEMDTSSVDQLK